MTLATMPTRSLLHWAAWQGNVEVMECLLEHGAEVDKYDVYSKTPLHLCCENLNYLGVKLLLSYGADPTLTDSEDYEPLHYVAAGGGGGSSGMGVGGGFRIARLLLETEQIDIDACSQDGTPLHLACKRGDFSIIQLLVSYGANVNSWNLSVRFDVLCPTRKITPLSCLFHDTDNKDEF